MAVIEIYVDQVWAGSGKLAHREGGYRIEDCGAQFCDDNDESMEVYDSIEEAIEAGKKSITVELEGESKKITWTVTESEDEDDSETRQVTYDFMGSVSNDKTEAANAVVAALESIQPDDPNEMTDDVIDAAVEFLGGDWDRESVLAALDGCCFSYVE
jgi:hypothetical protein